MLDAHLSFSETSLHTASHDPLPRSSGVQMVYSLAELSGHTWKDGVKNLKEEASGHTESFCLLLTNRM